MTNIKWIRDEYILVLDLYFKHRFERSASENPRLAEYSELLRSMHKSRTNIGPQFRSTSSIAIRMHNFKACDPYWREQGVDGMRDGAQGMTRAIWDEFYGDTEIVHDLANQIKSSLQSPANDEEASNINGNQDPPVQIRKVKFIRETGIYIQELKSPYRYIILN